MRNLETSISNTISSSYPVDSEIQKFFQEFAVLLIMLLTHSITFEKFSTLIMKSILTVWGPIS